MLAALNNLLTLVEAVLGIGLLIFAHEFGHFVFAKLHRVKVDVFSLGFGRRLFGFTRGGTDYRVSLIPLGGYVKMAGETLADARTGSPDELTSKSAWQRLSIFAAGPAMNFLVAVPLCVLTYAMGIWRVAPEIGEIYPYPQCPEWSADVQRGDVITAVNGEPVFALDDYRLAMMMSKAGSEVEVTVKRGGAERTVSVTSVGAELIPPDGVKENVVGGMKAGSPAEKAGLLVGDRIVEVAGTPVRNFVELARAIRMRPVQATALAVEREGAAAPLTLTLVPRAEKEFTLDLEDAQAPIVGSAKAGSPCWRPGQEVRPGDRIVAVTAAQSVEVATRQELRAALDGRFGQPTRVTVKRGDATLELEAVPAPDFLGNAGLDLAFASGLELLKVAPASPLAKAGLAAGDKLVSAEGKDLSALDELELAAVRSQGKPLSVQYSRGGALFSATLEPRTVAVGRADIAPRTRRVLRQYPLGESLVQGAKETWKLVVLTYVTLQKLLTKEVSATQLSGPVKIFTISYSAAEEGTTKFLWLLAFISVNLGVVNFLPVPILDGGHIMFLLIEKIKGSPVSETAFLVAQWAGLAALLLLVVFVTWNDIVSFFPVRG
ncbi:MAG: RIP metalloprotease RseP [Planctomycetes bacterium]|nr:RIP metalloprotease RseP [Planctomycetota bacterium]